jgi:hypothetical protein
VDVSAAGAGAITAGQGGIAAAAARAGEHARRPEEARA